MQFTRMHAARLGGPIKIVYHPESQSGRFLPPSPLIAYFASISDDRARRRLVTTELSVGNLYIYIPPALFFRAKGKLFVLIPVSSFSYRRACVIISREFAYEEIYRARFALRYALFLNTAFKWRLFMTTSII